MKIRRSDSKNVSLCRVSETTRAIGPDVSGIGAIDAKAFLFVTGFFDVGKRTVIFTGVGGIRLRDQVCRSGN